MRAFNTADGFSLLEALIAATLLAGAIAGLAQLVTRAAEQAGRAARVTVATTLAQSKLEQLRAAAFQFDVNGARLDDVALALSAGDALRRDAPPHVEALGRFGEVLPQETTPTYVRRWSVATAPNDPDTVIVAVCVLPATHARQADTCVWTTRTRQP
jgi:type II secretory pathway pseudopilin PulG